MPAADPSPSVSVTIWHFACVAIGLYVLLGSYTLQRFWFTPIALFFWVLSTLPLLPAWRRRG